MNEANVFDRQFVPNYRESVRLLGKNFWKITTGAILFIINHPICCWGILWERLMCVFRSTTGEFKTPEGITLRHYFHFYLYGAIFIERNLHHSGMLRDLKHRICPTIIDVGANCGFFSQWIGSYNSTAWFFSFEPCSEYNIDHKRILKEVPLNVHLTEAAVGDFCGKVNLEIGNNLFISEKGRVVDMVTIDSKEYPGPEVFLLKIDTDGSNRRVLAGAVKTLERTRWCLIEKEGNIKDYWKYFKGWTRYDISPDDLIFFNANL